MLSKLQKLRDQLQDLLDKAEELSLSDNERTAEKYANVSDNLSAAIDAIEEAISELET